MHKLCVLPAIVCFVILIFSNAAISADSDEKLKFSFVKVDGKEVCQSNYGGNCIHLAAMTGNTLVLSRLLKQGVDINARDGLGATAVMWAANRGEMAVLIMLISHKADVNCRDADDRGGHTALMYADPNRLDVVKYLLEHGADPNIRTRDGLTASEEALQQAEGNRRMPYREEFVNPNISKAKFLRSYEKKQ